MQFDQNSSKCWLNLNGAAEKVSGPRNWFSPAAEGVHVVDPNIHERLGINPGGGGHT